MKCIFVWFCESWTNSTCKKITKLHLYNLHVWYTTLICSSLVFRNSFLCSPQYSWPTKITFPIQVQVTQIYNPALHPRKVDTSIYINVCHLNVEHLSGLHLCQKARFARGSWFLRIMFSICINLESLVSIRVCRDNRRYFNKRRIVRSEFTDTHWTRRINDCTFCGLIFDHISQTISYWRNRGDPWFDRYVFLKMM